MTDLTACREAFEKWILNVAKVIIGSSDPYPAGLERDYWRVWQAAWNTRADQGGEAVAWQWRGHGKDGTSPWQDCTKEDFDRHDPIRDPHGAVRALYTHLPRATAAEDARDAATLVKLVQKNAQSAFEEYVLANYRPGCIISDPRWHAPRLFRAAVYAIDAALSAQRGEVASG
jgi:hypothetical protein